MKKDSTAAGIRRDSPLRRPPPVSTDVVEI